MYQVCQQVTKEKRNIARNSLFISLECFSCLVARLVLPTSQPRSNLLSTILHDSSLSMFLLLKETEERTTAGRRNIAMGVRVRIDSLQNGLFIIMLLHFPLMVLLGGRIVLGVGFVMLLAHGVVLFAWKDLVRFFVAWLNCVVTHCETMLLPIQLFYSYSLRGTVIWY